MGFYVDTQYVSETYQYYPNFSAAPLVTMDTKKFVLAGLIGGVAYFFLGWLVYGILLMDLMAIPEEFRSIIEYPEEEFRISYMIAA